MRKLVKYKELIRRGTAFFLMLCLASAPLPARFAASGAFLTTAEAAGNAGNTGNEQDAGSAKAAGPAEAAGNEKAADPAEAAGSGAAAADEAAGTDGAAGQAGDPSAAAPDAPRKEFTPIYTKDGIEDLPAERKANLKAPAQTNADKAWPQEKDGVGAAGAIVMDADSGEVLYGKDIYMHLYPASITKVMTALLAYENLRPTDSITFSENAVFGIERGSSNIGMDVGESITVDQALYGLMVASANEVAVALGERVSGSEADFVSLMNERAAQLGCRDTHFVTTNGLHDSEHYTCAYDMALIAREAWRHPDLIEYMSQTNYHFEASDTQPDDFWIGNTNNFLSGVFNYDGIIGGKTGYTDEARETLVTFAERDGVRLICVIMREEPPYQYYDTIQLLDYAFENFRKVRIAEEETRFTMRGRDFLSKGPDIFGSSAPAYAIDEGASLLLPNDTAFSELSASIEPFTYTQNSGIVDNLVDNSEDSGAGISGTSAAEEAGSASGGASVDSGGQTAADGRRILGVVRYRFHDYDLASADVLFTPAARQAEGSGSPGSLQEGEGAPAASEEVHGIRALAFGLVHTGAHGSIFLNILLLVPLLLAASFLLCFFFWVHSYFTELKRHRKRKARRAAVKKTR